MFEKYWKAIQGLCPATLSRAWQYRSLGELEYASCVAANEVRKIPSKSLRSIPVLWLDRLMRNEEKAFEVQLTMQAYEDGEMPIDDRMVLLYLLKCKKPEIVLEIGTYMGHTARAMAENSPESLIHTVDLPADFDPSEQKNTSSSLPKDDFHLIGRRRVGREYLGTACEKRIYQHFGDTGTWDFQKAAGATFFFIDGSHTYEYVKNDTEKCLRLCGGKGVFLWHDVDDRHPGVVDYLAELIAGGREIVRFANTSLAYWDGSRVNDRP